MGKRNIRPWMCGDRPFASLSVGVVECFNTHTFGRHKLLGMGSPCSNWFVQQSCLELLSMMGQYTQVAFVRKLITLLPSHRLNTWTITVTWSKHPVRHFTRAKYPYQSLHYNSLTMIYSIACHLRVEFKTSLSATTPCGASRITIKEGEKDA